MDIIELITEGVHTQASVDELIDRHGLVPADVFDAMVQAGLMGVVDLERRQDGALGVIPGKRWPRDLYRLPVVLLRRVHGDCGCTL